MNGNGNGYDKLLVRVDDDEISTPDAPDRPEIPVDSYAEDVGDWATLRDTVAKLVAAAEGVEIPGKPGKFTPGNPAVLFDLAALAAIRKFREVLPTEYWQIDARWRARKNLALDTVRKLEKMTKPKDNTPKGVRGASESKADILTALVRNLAELFFDADQDYYATVMVDNADGLGGEHAETFLLRSDDFRRWAAKVFFSRYQTSPGDAGFRDALETLEGFAADGEQREVFLRPAEYAGGVYVALHNPDCQIVEIKAGSWAVIGSADCPVRFRRTKNSRPLPVPVRDGSIHKLWKHVNLVDQDTRWLVEAWLMESLRIDTPFPVMEVSGEQGSAKSTASKRFCDLIDPAKVALRRRPKTPDDLFVGAKHSHLLCYDNMSSLSSSEQDALCIMSTGGGFATRRLHTTNEEEMWETKRPVIIGGISELATNADLGDRIVAVELPKIGLYAFEGALNDAWQTDYPSILGGMYDLMAKTLAKLPEVVIKEPPRMADFARLGQAMFLATDNPRDFTEVFLANRDRVVTRAIESSPIALAVLRMMDDFSGVWMGKTSDLLSDLTSKYKPSFYDVAAWPKSPRGLGGVLRRIAPSLRLRGIEFEHKRGNEGWTVTISKVGVGKRPALPVPSEVLI